MSLVSSYSASGLPPAPVMLGGWLASCPPFSNAPPPSQRSRSWGGVFRNRREKNTGSKACWEFREAVWEGTAVWLSCESDVKSLKVFLHLPTHYKVNFFPSKACYGDIP